MRIINYQETHDRHPKPMNSHMKLLKSFDRSKVDRLAGTLAQIHPRPSLTRPECECPVMRIAGENYISISFGVHVRYPLNPLNTIVLWCTGGLCPPDAERRQSLGQL